MGRIRSGVIGVSLSAALLIGCARPSTPTAAEEPPPLPRVVRAPAATSHSPPAAPERPGPRHSRFFSKTGPAELDKLAARCAPKDPQWKWYSVFSSLHVGSEPEPGRVYYFELGRYFRCTPAALAQFLETFEIEFAEMLHRGGVRVTDCAAFADMEAPDDVLSDGFSLPAGFSFGFASDSARGTARATVSRHRDGSYQLVVRVEEAVVVKAP